MVWTVESMDLKLMLYPNLTFGKSSIVQRDKIHGKNNSNGQGKLVQKKTPSFRSCKRAIRYASIIISDWQLEKQLKTISQNRG